MVTSTEIPKCKYDTTVGRFKQVARESCDLYGGRLEEDGIVLVDDEQQIGNVTAVNVLDEPTLPLPLAWVSNIVLWSRIF